MSYARFDCRDIIGACARFTENRQKQIEKRKEQAIQELMAKRFFASKTREAAIDKLKLRDGFFSRWSLMEMHSVAYQERVDNILALASLADTLGDSYVNLSADDIAILAPHFDE